MNTSGAIREKLLSDFSSCAFHFHVSCNLSLFLCALFFFPVNNLRYFILGKIRQSSGNPFESHFVFEKLQFVCFEQFFII